MKQLIKRLVPLCLFFLLTLPLSAFLSAEESPSLEIINAARQGICDFVEAERSSGHSLQQGSQILAVENSEVKDGVQVYTVSPAQLISSSDLNGILIPTGLWRFVVAKENQPVSLVSMAHLDGQWRAVSLGGAKLAEEVQKVMNSWPASEGYSFRFVRIFQAHTDFMQISRDGKVMGFVPLAAARGAFKIDGPFNSSLLLHANEIQTPLRNLVKRELMDMDLEK